MNSLQRIETALVFIIGTLIVLKRRRKLTWPVTLIYAATNTAGAVLGWVCHQSWLKGSR